MCKYSLSSRTWPTSYRTNLRTTRNTSCKGSSVAEEGITAIAQCFIAEHFESVLQLELLLYLAARPEESRTVRELGRELKVDPMWLARELSLMTQKGWIEAFNGTPARFRFAPQTAAQRRVIADVASAYASHRVTVIGLIFANPQDKRGTFSSEALCDATRADGPRPPR